MYFSFFFSSRREEIRKLVNEGCPDILLTITIECCNDEPDRRPELNMASTELKVAYRDLTDEEYLDMKNAEQLQMEELKRLEYLRLIEEAEEEERLEQEQELKKQQEVEIAVKILAPFPGASVRAKKRGLWPFFFENTFPVELIPIMTYFFSFCDTDSTMKIDSHFFDAPLPPPLTAAAPATPTSPTTPTTPLAFPTAAPVFDEPRASSFSFPPLWFLY